ncbi:MAG: hypothetical protein HY909_08830 [Deltaproteobacteria bacterium]|nr:hypothetical protein [Deltaproteobacteria bacterium]
MNRKVIAAGALAALGALGALELQWRRAEVPKKARIHQEIQALSQCLLGSVAPSASSSEDERRARLRALSGDPSAWPGPCQDKLQALRRSLRERPSEASRELLPLAEEAHQALSALTPGVLAAFREGATDALPVAWIAPLRALLARAGARSGVPSRSSGGAGPRALGVGEVLPIPLTAASSMVAASARGGVLGLFFVDPSSGAVLCRTRDQGQSMRCQRLRVPSGTVVTLVPGDTPEALVLVERRDATGSRSLSVASPDALEAPLFTLPEPPLRSLPLLVSGDRLLAITMGPGGASLVQVPRGGGPGSAVPYGLPAEREALLVRGQDAVWALGVGDGQLLARRVGDSDAGAAAPVVVSRLQGIDAVLSRCDADRGAWVVASDRGETVVLRVASGAPSRVGSARGLGFPVTLSCDDLGVTLVGGDRVASCTEARCDEGFADTGTRRVVRFGDGLLRVSLTPNGALRASVHGLDGARRSTHAVRDDAAHGGLSVQNLWLATVSRGVVLLGAGEPSVALSSRDGARWDFAREGVEVPLRPLRPRDLLPSRR